METKIENLSIESREKIEDLLSLCSPTEMIASCFKIAECANESESDAPLAILSRIVDLFLQVSFDMQEYELNEKTAELRGIIKAKDVLIDNLQNRK